MLTIYSHPTLYHLVMRLLYKQYFNARYIAIAAEIPEGSSVIDICAGDCYLYRKFLHKKSISYLALDISPPLVRWAQKQGIQAREFNLWKDGIPTSEIIVMQASLYQFLPETKFIMHKLLSAATSKVIISEPIRNVSSSPNPLLVTVSRYLTRPSSSRPYLNQRFNQASLVEFFKSFPAFERLFPIPGGREIIGIFQGQHK